MIVARESSRCIDKSKVIGYEHQVRSLKKELLRPGDYDRLKTIGVIGMAAIGKTTLCQLIFDDDDVKGFFLPRIWVCMSKRGDESEDEIVAVHKKMLVCLGVEEKIVHEVYDQHRLEGLSKALHLLLAGKRYLIVLDDAWDSSLPREGKWEDLSCGLPKVCGGAVIVTSRNEILTKTIIGREGFLYRVPPLSDELCWSLFKRELVELEQKLELCWPLLKKELDQHKNGEKAKERLKNEFKEVGAWFKRVGGIDEAPNQDLPKKSKEIGQAQKKEETDGTPNQNTPEKEKEKEIDEDQKKKQIEEARNLKKKILELCAGIPLAAKLLAKSSTKMWAKNGMEEYVKKHHSGKVISEENMLLKEFLDSFHDDNK